MSLKLIIVLKIICGIFWLVYKIKAFIIQNQLKCIIEIMHIINRFIFMMTRRQLSFITSIIRIVLIKIFSQNLILYWIDSLPNQAILTYGGSARSLYTGKTLWERKPISLGLSFVFRRYRVDVLIWMVPTPSILILLTAYLT
jgi:hypothetical protein